MLHHAGRQMVQGRDGLGSQAGEHGIRAPAAESGNGVVVHTGTQESRGSPRAEALDREKVRWDASVVLDQGSTEAEPVGELRAADETPPLRWCAVVSKDGSGRLSPMGHEVPHYPAHGADRTKVRGGSGSLSDDLPFVAILLFSKEDADIGDVSNHTFVIQDGGLVALVGAVVQGEPDVAKFKSLGAQGDGFMRGVRAKKLTGAH